MKIQQMIPMSSYDFWLYNAAYIDCVVRHYFRKSDYSNIDAIYLEFTAWCDNVTTTGKLQLYDFTNDVAITGTTTDISGTARTQYRTGDIKDALVGNLSLGIKAYRSAGSGTVHVLAVRLIIRQTAVGTNRKTALHLVQSAYGFTTSVNYVSVSPPLSFKPLLNDINGTKSVKAVVYLQASGGGLSYCRLYDVTASAAVPDCTFSTNAGTLQLLESPELTLDPSHEYIWQYKSWNQNAAVIVSGAEIRIVSTGFSKIVATPYNIQTDFPTPTGNWVDVWGSALWEPAYWDGADGLSYKTRSAMSVQAYGAWANAVRFWNKTQNVEISDTDHSESGTTNADFVYEDTVTMPSIGSDELVGQENGNAMAYYSPLCILAFQIENLPAPSLPADPTQPSGYHCFMSQFLRNIISGRTPLKTPDGVNQCW